MDSADGRPATVLVQSPRYGDVIGLLAGALAVAVGVRGFAGDQAAVGVLGVVALAVVAAGWARFRLRPRFELRVDDERLCYGRAGSPGRCFEHGEVDLEVQGGWRQGMFLHPAGEHPSKAIGLFGFDSAEVINACTAHGWYLR